MQMQIEIQRWWWEAINQCLLSAVQYHHIKLCHITLRYLDNTFLALLFAGPSSQTQASQIHTTYRHASKSRIKDHGYIMPHGYMHHVYMHFVNWHHGYMHHKYVQCSSITQILERTITKQCLKSQGANVIKTQHHHLIIIIPIVITSQFLFMRSRVSLAMCPLSHHFAEKSRIWLELPDDNSRPNRAKTKAQQNWKTQKVEKNFNFFLFSCTLRTLWVNW